MTPRIPPREENQRGIGIRRSASRGTRQQHAFAEMCCRIRCRAQHMPAGRRMRRMRGRGAGRRARVALLTDRANNAHGERRSCATRFGLRAPSCRSDHRRRPTPGALAPARSPSTQSSAEALALAEAVAALPLTFRELIPRELEELKKTRSWHRRQPDRNRHNEARPGGALLAHSPPAQRRRNRRRRLAMNCDDDQSAWPRPATRARRGGAADVERHAARYVAAAAPALLDLGAYAKKCRTTRRRRRQTPGGTGVTAAPVRGRHCGSGRCRERLPRAGNFRRRRSAPTERHDALSRQVVANHVRAPLTGQRVAAVSSIGTRQLPVSARLDFAPPVKTCRKTLSAEGARISLDGTRSPHWSTAIATIRSRVRTAGDRRRRPPAVTLRSTSLSPHGNGSVDRPLNRRRRSPPISRQGIATPSATGRPSKAPRPRED